MCAISGSQYLTPSGWTELRNVVDLDVPFRLFRDEGRTFLQVIYCCVSLILDRQVKIANINNIITSAVTYEQSIRESIKLIKRNPKKHISVQFIDVIIVF